MPGPATFHARDEHPFGFSWVADEPVARASHALVADGRVWLVDPVDWPEAVERAAELGTPAAVVQLLDRHNRDCATVAARLGVEHLTVPAALPGSPFEVAPVVRAPSWREAALWWPERRVLVVAEAVGTNRFFTGGGDVVGVHPLLRLTPPRRCLGRFQPVHLLVGHGDAVHGPDAAAGLERALRRSRRDLPRLLVELTRRGVG